MAPAEDLVDERGHTVEDAKAQHPNLDAEAPAASQQAPEAGQMVRAQTPEEVEAQIVNRAGAADDSHDQDEQLEAAAEADGDKDNDAEGDDDK